MSLSCFYRKYIKNKNKIEILFPNNVISQLTYQLFKNGR